MSSIARKDDGGSSSQSRRRRRSGLLQVRRRRKSAAGAIVLSAVTVVFIVLSYRTGSLLFQFDSIVSFIAALILLFRDTSHTVQARVVNRILTSSHQMAADLSAYGLGGSSFLYVPEGRKVGDVMLVPVKEGEVPTPSAPAAGEGEAGIQATHGASTPPSSEGAFRLTSAGGTSDASGGIEAQKRTGGAGPEDVAEGKKTTMSISNLKFTPPGRAMAELFLRDVALKDPTMDDIILAIPQALVDGFQLADSSIVRAASSDSDAIQVTLGRPVLTDSCSPPNKGGTGIVGCEICSMLAVLFSSSTGRLVSLHGCAHDENSDTTTVSLHLGAKYPAD